MGVNDTTIRRYGIQYKSTNTLGKSTTKTINGLNFPNDDDEVPQTSGATTVEGWRKGIAKAFVNGLMRMSDDTLTSVTLIRYEEVEL